MCGINGAINLFTFDVYLEFNSERRLVIGISLSNPVGNSSMSKGTPFERATSRGARYALRKSIFAQSEGVVNAISLQDLETETRVNGALSSGSSYCDSKSASTANLKIMENISGGRQLIEDLESFFRCVNLAGIIRWTGR